MADAEPAPPAPPPELYSSAAGEAALRQLYVSTLIDLSFPEERLVPTSFGTGSVVVCGPSDAPPLVVWHGTAAPAPDMLLEVPQLVERFRVYAPDIPCQAGSRSDPALLDPATHAYGRWAAEVVLGLGLLRGTRPPVHVGVSLGALVLLDLAVVKPEAICGAALLSPGMGLEPVTGQKRRMPWQLALGFALYRWLPCAPAAWLALAPMCDEPRRAPPVLDNVKLAISYFPDAPGPFTDEQLRCLAGVPVLVEAPEHDVFGSAQAAVERARAVWPDCEAVLVRGAKHMPGGRGMRETNERMIKALERTTMATKRAANRRRSLLSYLALAWGIGGFLLSVFSLLVCALNVHRPAGAAGLALLLGSVLLPLHPTPPRWAARFLARSVAELRAYFPINVIYEDEAAFASNKPGSPTPGPFVVGYEPHSVLPLGMCVFSPHARDTPPSLSRSVIAATSTLFLAPGMRHMCYWLGCRSASRQVLQQSLAEGSTVVLCPGGVAECFEMDPRQGHEVAFLRSRTGFVRLAMQAGAPIVPAFAFGQTAHYSWWRPFIDWPKQLVPRGAMGSFVRRIGYVPMLAWGILGSALPRQVPMTIAVGRPIPVPHTANPSKAEVQATLDAYIAALQGIFERHKAAAGHAHDTLTVL
ncbi:Diacylglycerol O-acyltransferase 2 isoform A [Micractinium conductrix]|uniref:Diacylglycerol O-acyltransferase 2 isoform A n=1 Tax=Micractinium conductrix TaxID=554055 RepID=A0A2P6VGF7_9CHLO|nr:Diacylglycerol O-acyltransferase 2 isoform A [Micractinium conductrix]|eukprot:PSC73157.1 Diacylglycerol O-acyltransferase 2 isoform A [Micractinium conductrix]